jgi:hypothetical protein
VQYTLTLFSKFSPSFFLTGQYIKDGALYCALQFKIAFHTAPPTAAPTPTAATDVVHEYSIPISTWSFSSQSIINLP